MASTLLINLTVLSAIISIAYSVGLYEQCDGEGYGTFPCNYGLTCFRRNQWYSSCQFECPRNQGWACEGFVAPTAIPAVAIGWDQCGGDGWLGPRVCAAGFACYARSVFYSQCRPVYDCPADWACNGFISTTVNPTAPVFLAPYSRCDNVGNGTAMCPVGYGCFRNSAIYSECRPSCPVTWACETDVAGLNEPCGGEGYVGLTTCGAGLNCYARNQWYSQCAAACPGAGWQC